MEHKHSEFITKAYWRVSHAVRHRPTSINLSYGKAVDLVHAAEDKTTPEHWRLKEHLHTLVYDMIEGNTQWRKDKDHKLVRAPVYQLTHSTPKLMSSVRS